jgi:hypothetical protein
MRFAPEIVRESSRADESPVPPNPVPTPEASNAERVLWLGVGAWVIQFACALLSLPLAFYARAQALGELTAIAALRRPVAGRKNALLGYWLAQSMIWVWLFTVGLILVIGIILIPILVLTVD